jgi:hypothetical protein
MMLFITVSLAVSVNAAGRTTGGPLIAGKERGPGPNRSERRDEPAAAVRPVRDGRHLRRSDWR